ncbi:MAG: hypothetical protein WCO69_00825 [Candidatus Omnitrophota bacterium]
MSGCETKAGSCETPQNQPAPSAEKKGCCIENKMEELMCAAHEAKRQVMIDIMKTKIEKAWGKKMEKVADAVLAAMESEKKAMIIKGKAKKTYKEELTSIFTE